VSPVRQCRRCLAEYEDRGPGKRRGVPAGYCRKLCHQRDVAKAENRALAIHPRQCRQCAEGARLQLHHAVYRQELRRIANGDRRAFARLDADYRNLLPLCEECHAAHHSRVQALPVVVLPDSVFAFARMVMGDDRAYEYLRRRYSGSDERLDALLSRDEKRTA
jgi:hypothetical protein